MSSSAEAGDSARRSSHIGAIPEWVKFEADDGRKRQSISKLKSVITRMSLMLMLQVVVAGAAPSSEPPNLLCGPELSIARKGSQGEEHLQPRIVARLHPCACRLIV